MENKYSKETLNFPWEFKKKSIFIKVLYFFIDIGHSLQELHLNIFNMGSLIFVVYFSVCVAQSLDFSVVSIVVCIYDIFPFCLSFDFLLLIKTLVPSTFCTILVFNSFCSACFISQIACSGLMMKDIYVYNTDNVIFRIKIIFC